MVTGSTCADLEWKGGDPPACYVGANQVALADYSETDETVLVILYCHGDVRTPGGLRQSGRGRRANGAGSSIGLEPDIEFGNPAKSPSESVVRVTFEVTFQWLTSGPRPSAG